MNFFGTVRGTDNAVRVFSVRYVVRIMSYGFFGTVRVRIFYRTDTDFSNRYVFWYRFSKVLLSLPNYFRRHHGCPYDLIRTTYRTKKNRTALSVLRTVSKKFVPFYPYHVPYIEKPYQRTFPDRSGFPLRYGQSWSWT